MPQCVSMAPIVSQSWVGWGSGDEAQRPAVCLKFDVRLPTELFSPQGVSGGYLSEKGEPGEAGKRVSELDTGGHRLAQVPFRSNPRETCGTLPVFVLVWFPISVGLLWGVASLPADAPPILFSQACSRQD